MGLFCPAAGQCGPINPGITPQRDEHQGENLQAQILENTETPNAAQDMRHPAALAAQVYSEKNLAPAANLLHSSQSRISSPISLETCQVKVKTSQ